MKTAILTLSFLLIANSYGACDLKYANNALSEAKGMYNVYRSELIKLSKYRDEIYSDRKPLMNSFDSPEKLAEAIKKSNSAVKHAVNSSMNIVQECLDKLSDVDKFLSDYDRDSQKLKGIIENVYDQCSKSGDKDFRSILARTYKNRDSYQDNITHLRNERMASLRKKCSEEKKFLESSIALTKECDIAKSMKAMATLAKLEKAYRGELDNIKNFYKQNYVEQTPFHKYFKTAADLVDYLNKYGEPAKLSVNTTLANSRQCTDSMDSFKKQLYDSTVPARLQATSVIKENYPICVKTQIKFSKTLKPIYDNLKLYEDLENELINDWIKKVSDTCIHEESFIQIALNTQKSCN